MAMETALSIKVPTIMKEEIQEEVDNGPFSSTSDFVKAAIRSYLHLIRTERMWSESHTVEEPQSAPLTEKKEGIAGKS